ncbi:MAG: glycosyltransferase family 4 protein [Calditrichaeota bacterium]|nr:glycosyltransferase family 4 protein [Calditrichota bacterium]
MKKHKIAIVSPYPLDPAKTTGGIQAVVQNLVSSLKDDPELEIHVLTIDYDRDIPYKPVENVQVHWLPANKARNRLTLFAPEKKWIKQKIDELQPDLVHVHGTDIYGFATRNLGFPTLLTVHGILSKEAKIVEKNLKWRARLLNTVKNKFNHYFENATLRAAKHIIVISPYVEQQIQDRTAATFYHIDNPVDQRFFELDNRANPKQFLFVGMIRARKGVLGLAEAVQKLAEKHPDVKLHLVGKVFEPDYFDLLKKFIFEKHLENNIIYRGRLSDEELFREFENCQAVVMNSIEESSPMVIEQAMAAGKAVVATRVGGIPFLVEHGKSGLLVDYGNRDELAEALDFIYSNPDRAGEMGRYGKKIAEARFRQESIAKNTKDIYLKLIQSRSE